jgi:carboxylate-amine ligase
MADSTHFSSAEFRGSTEPTIGMELELQIVDPTTRDLAPGAPRILNGCQNHGLEGVTSEFLLCMLEVKSDVCASVAELRDNLSPRIRRLRNIARGLGYDLAMGGTHPFARPSMTAVFPGERYQEIERLHGWMAYQEAVFGLHVHVGVPDGDTAIGVTNLLVEYLPHLLALSANSPFWQGIDTDYMSSRMRMFRPSASCGVPLCFTDWADFTEYCSGMHEMGVLHSTKDLYWDIRPQPSYGTVEFRIFDVPATLSAALFLGALTRTLVVDAIRKLQAPSHRLTPDPFAFWQANENKWLATRFGIRSQCIRKRGAQRNSLADDCDRLLESVQPVAEDLRDAEFLNSIHSAGKFEIGADRQRRIYLQTGSLKAVVEDMSQYWVADFDNVVPLRHTNSAGHINPKAGSHAHPSTAAVEGQPPKPRLAS